MTDFVITQVWKSSYDKTQDVNAQKQKFVNTSSFFFKIRLCPKLPHFLFLFQMDVVKSVQSNMVTICPFLRGPF